MKPCNTILTEIQSSCEPIAYNQRNNMKAEMIVRIHRNDMCACGSGVKFKRCCIKKQGKKARVKLTRKQ